MADERLLDFWAKTFAARSPYQMRQLRGVAHGLLATRRALRSTMPAEFVYCPSLDMLFALFLADRQMLSLAALTDATPVAPQVTRRWVDVFVQRDLVTLRHGEVLLSEAGFAMLADACLAVIESQSGALVQGLN